MDGVERRELVYFVAVAEELHFGRAAERLGIAQPPLSRAIQRLERRIDVALLTRTSRTVQLTPAGQVMLDESRNVLEAMDAAVRRAQRAAASVPRLRVALKPDGDAGLLEQILPAYRSEPDAVEVEVVVCGIDEQAPLVRRGEVDLALVPSFADVAGLDSEVLLTLDQVAVLPRGHRLASRSALVLADLDGERRPRHGVVSDDTGSGPVVRDPGQLMQLVALGEVVDVVPSSVRRHLRDDVVCVPVLDAPTTSILLVWPEGASSAAIAGFVRTSTDIAHAVAAPTSV